MLDSIQAIVYIPEGLARDGTYAVEGVAHIARRGYQLVGVLRDWTHVVRMLGAGAVSVVVFARLEHWDRSSWAAWNVEREFVGEETRRLAWLKPQGAAVNRRASFESGGGAIINEVTAYRAGYADGYVDSTTIRSAPRPRRWRG